MYSLVLGLFRRGHLSITMIVRLERVNLAVDTVIPLENALAGENPVEVVEEKEYQLESPMENLTVVAEEENKR